MSDAEAASRSCGAPFALRWEHHKGGSDEELPTTIRPDDQLTTASSPGLDFLLALVLLAAAV